MTARRDFNFASPMLESRSGPASTNASVLVEHILRETAKRGQISENELLAALQKSLDSVSGQLSALVNLGIMNMTEHPDEGRSYVLSKSGLAALERGHFAVD